MSVETIGMQLTMALGRAYRDCKKAWVGRNAEFLFGPVTDAIRLTDREEEDGQEGQRAILMTGMATPPLGGGEWLLRNGTIQGAMVGVSDRSGRVVFLRRMKRELGLYDFGVHYV